MKKSRFLASLLPLMILLLLAISLPAAAVEYDNSRADLETARMALPQYSFFDLGEDFSKIKSMAELMQALKAVDPYAQYMSAEDIAEQDDTYFGSYVGIGVLMQQTENRETAVRCVYANTVAARADIRRGDIIYSIDGELCAGKSVAEVKKLLDGKDNTVLRLTIKRGDVIMETMDVKRAEMPNPGLYYWLEEDGVAYIRITRFISEVDGQLSAGMEFLRQQGATSILLDLRDCPGGLMDAAGECAALLIGDGPIFYNVVNSGYRSFYAVEEDIEPLDLPLAVLVNERSASAAEMLSAVVQDSAVGTVIGSGTFGKGYYQTMLNLPSGANIYFTMGKFVSWGRQDIAGQNGVTPDILVQDGEQQLARAMEWLKTQQAAAKQISFRAGDRNAATDNGAWTLTNAPFNRDGRVYVPAAEFLNKLGWELHFYQNQWYASNGIRRLIFEAADNGALTSGNKTDSVAVLGNVAYIPATFLNNVGYTVSWNEESKMAEIIK